MESKKNLKDLHFEHKLWINELTFFKQELEIYQDRLEELAQKNTNPDMKALQEQFQNRFIRQNEVIDELMHNMTIHEQELTNTVKENPTASDHVHFGDHNASRESMDTFRKLYTDLKEDFHGFSSEWM